MTDKKTAKPTDQTPEGDAAPQFEKSHADRHADGLASAEPRKVPGKTSPEGTYSQDKKSNHT